MQHLTTIEPISLLDNLENNQVGLYDLQLEVQVQFLEFTKKFKDCERGKARGKGFGNCWKLNSKRDPKVYTYLEADFKELADKFGLNLAHEIRIKVKDRLNKYHTYKLDFFDPIKRIDIEISPNWHKNYKIVERRDALRKILLNRLGIKCITVPVGVKCGRCVINRAIAHRTINTVLKAKISPNCLDSYIGGKNEV